MRKTKKCLFACMLAVCLVIAMIPMAAFATTGITIESITIDFGKYTFTTSENEITCPQNAAVESIEVTLTDASGITSETKITVKVDGAVVTADYGAVAVEGNVVTITPAAEAASAATLGTATFHIGDGDAIFTMQVEDPAVKGDFNPSQIAGKVKNSILPSAKTGKITLTEDLTIDKCLTVDAGETIILDLGTFTLSSSHDPYTVHVRGTADSAATLTIVGSGKVENTSAGSTVIDADLYGVLNIGTEDAEEFPTVTRGETTNGAGNSAIKGDELSTINIYGGTIGGDERSVQSYGTTTIVGGTFEQNVDICSWTDATTGYDSVMTIKGGKFNGPVYSYDYAVSGVTPSGTIDVEISGGNFELGFEDAGWIADGYNMLLLRDATAEILSEADTIERAEAKIIVTLEGEEQTLYFESKEDAAEMLELYEAMIESGEIEGMEVALSNYYTVTFKNGEEAETVKIAGGDKVAKPADPEAREGYKFLGWYVSEDGVLSSTAYDFNTEVTSDLVLEANWEEVKAESEIPETFDGVTMTVVMTLIAAAAVVAAMSARKIRAK